MNKALIETATGRCVNIIIVGDNYIVPAGHELQTADDAAKNKIWNGTGYDPIPSSYYDELDEDSARDFKNVGSVNRAILQAFFEHENRIRVLESRPSVTSAQVYNWFKDKIRG